MTTFTHSMKDLCDQLDVKIAALEEVLDTVILRIKDGAGDANRVAMNTAALVQIQESLSHTRDARAAAESSCCSYTCDINYE